MLYIFWKVWPRPFHLTEKTCLSCFQQAINHVGGKQRTQIAWQLRFISFVQVRSPWRISRPMSLGKVQKGNLLCQVWRIPELCLCLRLQGRHLQQGSFSVDISCTDPWQWPGYYFLSIEAGGAEQVSSAFISGGIGSSKQFKPELSNNSTYFRWCCSLRFGFEAPSEGCTLCDIVIDISLIFYISNRMFFSLQLSLTRVKRRQCSASSEVCAVCGAGPL